MRKSIFSLVFLCAVSAFSQESIPNGISLLPILNELNLERTTSVIQINSDQDLRDGLSGKGKPVQIQNRTYPFESFAAASSRLIAVRFHRAVTPDDSDLDRKAVLIEFADGKPRILKVLAPLSEKNLTELTSSDLSFVDERTLRIEVLGEEKEEFQGYGRTYQFFDVLTNRQITLSEGLGIDVIHARAYSNHHYLVAHKVGADLVFSFVDFDFATGKVEILEQFKDLSFGLRLQHDPVDELGRDVWTVHRNFTIVHQDDQKIAIGTNFNWSYKDLGASAKTTPVLGANALYKRSVDRGVIELLKLDARGKLELLHKYTVEEDSYLNSPAIKVEGGFVIEEGNHPNYGFIFFGEDGSVRRLSPARFRLIFSVVQSGVVLGVGNNLPNNDVKFYSLPVSDKPATSSVEAPVTGLTAGQNKKFPVVSRIAGGRYVVVQMAPTLLGIVDLFMNEQIVKQIKLKDETYKIEHLLSSTLIEYPKLGIRDSLRRPSFEVGVTHTIEACKDLLKGDESKTSDSRRD